MGTSANGQMETGRGEGSRSLRAVLAQLGPKRRKRPARTPGVTQDPTVRALLAVVLFTYTAQNMLNVSVAPLARQLHLPEWSVGAALSLAALTVALLSQFWGRRSVAWGARRVILLALTCAMIAGLLFSSAVWARSAGLIGLAATASAVILSRGPFFGAAVAAIPPTGQALISRLTATPKERVRGMAAFSGAINASIMVGSLVSSTLALWWIEAPVHATPVFIAIALGIAWFALPRDGGKSRKAKRGQFGQAKTTPPKLPPRVAWNDRRILPWMLGAFGSFFSVGVTQILAGFVVQDRLGVAAQQAVPLTAMILLAHATGAMVMQLIVVPRLGWMPLQLLRRGVSLGFVALLAIALAGQFWLLVLAALAAGVAGGMVGPGFTAGGSLSVTPEEQGGVAGVQNATGAVTWVFAPLSATALYGWWPLAPFLLALSVLGISVVVAWTHPRLRRPLQAQM